ncbi:hypothetical protein DMH25_19215 [Streptomyces sp. WAC 01325]|uniref:hypothetical protein n=1 Tax=Streptomyces sp. WAC 01325 TaxID=2203202 RepID=UPI000F88F40C|nr:hypothetical protein [Streptomyces sp. WAC 01325]RSN06158.1 hypothetical protein DMH25_19215 [Streptomyces sp. WAC 01325]
MRRHVAGPVLLALLLSACSAGKSDVNSQAPASSSPSAMTANPSKAPRDPLALPEKPDFLLPVTKGTDSRALPVFTPAEKVYTIHALCTGKGTMTIQYGPKDSDPSKITCDDPVTVGRVYTAPDEQKHLSVKVNGTDVHWPMAILSGTHAM